MRLRSSAFSSAAASSAAAGPVSSGARCAVRLWARRTGPPGPELDDRDRAQVHRPHPEPLEGQVEQGQQDDLEDPVVTDHDGPRLDGRRLAVPGDLGPIERPGRPAVGEPRQKRAERRPDPCLDGGQRLATGRPAVDRAAAPGRELGAVAGLDLVAAQALPGPLVDLGEPGIGPADDRPALLAASRRRWPRPSRSCAGEGSGPGPARAPAGTGSAGAACGIARRVATIPACCRPIPVSALSAWPWKRPSAMNVDSPWRTRTRVASRPPGMSGGSAAVSARSRDGSSTGRGRPPASGSPRTRPPGRRRPAPGS